MVEIYFVFAGALSGFLSGSMGVGGALLSTPLIRLGGVSPLLAIGTTVPAILPSALTGAWSYWRAGLISRRHVIWIAPSAGLGSVIGALATRRVPGDGHLLMILTAGLLLFMAIRLVPDKPDAGAETEPSPPGRSGLLVLGLATGFMSGLLGVGGGFVMVPILIKVFRLPIKVALGTSLAVISLTIIPNLVTQTFVHNVDWKVAGLLAAGVVPGAWAGAKLSISSSDRKLRWAFAAILGVTAIIYGVAELLQISSA